MYLIYQTIRLLQIVTKLLSEGKRTRK